ncbi:Ribonuclease HII [compost metagenome]
MTQLHEQFSGYDWVNNKGYPTKKHRDGIKKLGTTPFHRMSFTLLPDQLELEFSK